MLNVFEFIVGWSCALLLVFLFSINATYMLFAPRKWMTTDRWYFAQGALRYRRRYLYGKGDWELRIAGALQLGIIGYVIFNMLSR